MVFERSRGTASIPAHGVRTDRLGRGISQDLSDRRRPLSAWCPCRRRQARASRAGCASGMRRVGTCTSASMQFVLVVLDRGTPSRHPARVSRGGPRRPRAAGIVDDALGSAATVVRASFLAGPRPRLLARPRIRRWRPWRRCRSDWRVSCAATRPRHRVRRRPRLPGFREPQAPDAFTGHDRVPAADERCRTDRFSAGSTSTSLGSRRATAIRAACCRRAARALRFLLAVEPAVAGQHGDLRTFRICCRRRARISRCQIDEAISVLSEWNARCEPPWTERELLIKVQNARKYGREPLGGTEPGEPDEQRLMRTLV